MKKIKIIYFIMSMLTVWGSFSCDHNESDSNLPNVTTLKVRFNWSNVPNADPKGMCVIFYPMDESDNNVYRFDFSNIYEGEVTLGVGCYNVICYNNDTETVLFSNEIDFYANTGYTREGNVLEPIYGASAITSVKNYGSGGESVVICPDMMWGCTATNIEITNERVAETKVSPNQVITFYPRELVNTYTFEIRNVKNLNHVARMCASLSGMAGEFNFATGSCGTENVVFPAEASSDGSSTISGSFNAWHNDTNCTTHRLTLYVVLEDGSKYVYGTEGERFDVSTQIDNALDPQHVHIIIDGLDLPQSITDDGESITPSIDDWTEINNDIFI